MKMKEEKIWRCRKRGKKKCLMKKTTPSAWWRERRVRSKEEKVEKKAK